MNNVSVGAISNTYVGSGVTKKSAQIYTPGTSDQTIASGQYLSGDQTIKGDVNLVADNIKLGTSIFGVTGSYEGSSALNLQSKSVTYTSNGSATITPDAGYDGLSSVDVIVSVAGGCKIKKVTYTPRGYKLLTDVTISHNCGTIPKSIIVTSNNTNSAYLGSACGVNESGASSFKMYADYTGLTASVTTTELVYTGFVTTRYNSGTLYTYYFFY